MNVPVRNAGGMDRLVMSSHSRRPDRSVPEFEPTDRSRFGVSPLSPCLQI